MRFTSCVLLLLSTLLLTASPAGAAQRLALVIGNGGYRTAPLANPANDAELVADALSDTGFQVTRLTDANRQAMRGAIRSFADDVAAAGRNAVAVFYFGGHGVQQDGRNYLIPIGAELRSAADMEYEAIEAQWALDLIGESRPGVSIIVLDACRNNPFKSAGRSARRGLAQMDAPRGSILAYSTAPGDVALDGDGDNSPYSGALARMIREPGLKIEEMFKLVRRAVLVETGNKQIPWESSSLVGDFYFSGGTATASPGAAVGPRPGETFRDCPHCPEMTALAGGRFSMGSDSGERGHVAHEGPPTDVTVPPFALAQTEVTVAQFRAFVRDSGHTPSSAAGCWHWALVWLHDGGRRWDRPGHVIADDHPVSCVNWHDARAYADWLAARTGARYRLPSEAEWEYAAGGGARQPPWGQDVDQACAFANVYDRTAVDAYGAWAPTAACRDGHAVTAPAGAMPANALGLRDMFGNLQEWTADCWSRGHADRPAGAGARQDGDCNLRVFKGGHFASAIDFNRPAWRIEGVAAHPNVYSGFRVARDLD